MRATGRSIIAATTGKKPALEGFKGHGVFTFAVLEGLKGAADIVKQDRQITTDELNSYVWECVPQITKAKWGYEQLPMRDIQGHPFPILRIEADPTASGEIDCKLAKSEQ